MVRHGCHICGLWRLHRTHFPMDWWHICISNETGATLLFFFFPELLVSSVSISMHPSTGQPASVRDRETQAAVCSACSPWVQMLNRKGNQLCTNLPTSQVSSVQTPRAALSSLWSGAYTATCCPLGTSLRMSFVFPQHPMLSGSPSQCA